MFTKSVLVMKCFWLLLLPASIQISTAATIEARRGGKTAVHGPQLRQRSTPQGCRALNTDAEWPAPEVWEQALPGIVSRHTLPLVGPARPDYRFTAKSYEDVEKAVQFAANNNVRLTIISTGHDYMGRNDAPSGLSLDMSQLRGMKVVPSFTPSAQGVDSPELGVIDASYTPVPGAQAAVTIACGLAGSQANAAINGTGMFLVTGSTRKYLVPWLFTQLIPCSFSFPGWWLGPAWRAFTGQPFLRTRRRQLPRVQGGHSRWPTESRQQRFESRPLLGSSRRRRWHFRRCYRGHRESASTDTHFGTPLDSLLAITKR